MKLILFEQFLKETENVKVEKELREFTLTHKNGAQFQLKSKDFFKEFSVEPYKNETLDKLKEIFNRLVDALEQENVDKIYALITSAENLDYFYGGIFNSKFSLMLIPEIDTHLTDEQKTSLATSEREFLLNNYSQLSKDLKMEILDELSERAQILCCVIEALFYFVRDTDKKNYYNGMTTDEILEEYEEAIKEASKEVGFSYDGPSDSKDKNSPLSAESKKTYWLCEKNLKKFVIFGTISIEDLYSEENVGGTKGLKLSIFTPDLNSSDDDLNFFDLSELTKRVQNFYNKL